MFFTKENSSINRCKANLTYFPTKGLLGYFQSYPQTHFIVLDQYKELVEKDEEPLLIEFFEKVGVHSDPQLFEVEIPADLARKYDLPNPDATSSLQYFESRPEKFDEVFQAVKKNPKSAIVLWNVLLHFTKKDDFKNNFYFGNCRYFYHTGHALRYHSVLRKMLSSEKWLLTSRNELVAPNEVFLCELPEAFRSDEKEVSVLCDFLQIKKRKVEVMTQIYKDDHDFVERLRANGMLQNVEKMLKDKESQNKQSKK